ncbi:hypothetical protein [Pseudomonas anguilliseptica]|uniref:hypothetical protein n=1 Tax=Pseudomonas anguilliseptica TaxID=53406 RepID=UPI00325B3671
MSNFTIQSVDFDLGVCVVAIELPEGGQALLQLDPYSIATSDDATEGQMRDAIAQQVRARMLQLYPPIPPKPTALLGMVGKTYADAAQ